MQYVYSVALADSYLHLSQRWNVRVTVMQSSSNFYHTGRVFPDGYFRRISSVNRLHSEFQSLYLRLNGQYMIWIQVVMKAK
jgi:hypothetical protein